MVSPPAPRILPARNQGDAVGGRGHPLQPDGDGYLDQFPILADDDYVTKVFQLLKYGSDGTNPYTTTAHDPAAWTQGSTWYPGLLPGRKVYVEHSNELFSYYSYGDPQARVSIAAGDPWHINWNGASTSAGGGDAWSMSKTVRNSLIGRSVWGDAAMGDTIRIVYANQGDWGSWGRHQYGMNYLTAVWGPASPYATIGGFTNPKQPASYYIHNISGSFYVSPPGSFSGLTAPDLDTFFAQCATELANVNAMIGWGETMAATYGIKFSTYETGLQVVTQNLGAVGAAWGDPRMKTVYYNLLKQMMSKPHADVAVQSATVRGVYPGNELSRSYAASDGFPWPASGVSTPNQVWQAVLDVSAGR